MLDGNLEVSRKRLHRLFFSQPQRVLTKGFGKDLRDVWVGEKQCGFAMRCNYLVHHIWGTRCSTLKFWCERPTTFYNNNQGPTTTGLKISNECDDSTWTSTMRSYEVKLYGTARVQPYAGFVKTCVRLLRQRKPPRHAQDDVRKSYSSIHMSGWMINLTTKLVFPFKIKTIFWVWHHLRSPSFGPQLIVRLFR